MFGIGISSYSYPRAIKAAEMGLIKPITPLVLAERAVRFGVNILQICDNLPLSACNANELEELKTYCSENGISIEPGTRGINPELIEVYTEIGSKLQARILRTILPSGYTAKQMIMELMKLQPLLEHANIMLAIENYEKYSLADYREILYALPERYYGLCLDTANNLGRGEIPEQYVSDLGTRICCVHIKDVAATRLPSTNGFVIEGVPAGCGIVNIPGILADISRRACNYTVILEQWPPEKETLEETVEAETLSAEQGIRYLKLFAYTSNAVE